MGAPVESDKLIDPDPDPDVIITLFALLLKGSTVRGFVELEFRLGAGGGKMNGVGVIA